MKNESVLLREPVSSLSFEEDGLNFTITARYKNSERHYQVEKHYFYEIRNIYSKSRKFLHSTVIKSFDNKNKINYRLIGFYLDFK